MFLAQCLCTITEDNPTAAASLANSNESLKILEKNLMCSDATEELLLLKVHMAGKPRKKGLFSLTIPQHFCSCCDFLKSQVYTIKVSVTTVEILRR